MPATKLRAFISSTSDVVEEREALAEALPLSFEAYRYEKDRARKSSPRAHLEAVLSETDVFIGVLGARYGSVYPDCEGDPSIVKWEFETARGQEQTEVMAFKKTLDAGEIEPRQKRFLEELSHFVSGGWLLDYGSTSELTTRVRDSLLEWLVDFKLAEIDRPRPRTVPQVLLSLGLPLLFAVATIVEIYRRDQVPNPVIYLTGVVALAAMAAGALQWRR